MEKQTISERMKAGTVLGFDGCLETEIGLSAPLELRLSRGFSWLD